MTHVAPLFAFLQTLDNNNRKRGIAMPTGDLWASVTAIIQ